MGGLFGGGGQQQQMKAIHGSVDDYQRYRQEMAQAMLNSLSSASTAYQGMNNALETAWGAPAKPTGQPPADFARPAPPTSLPGQQQQQAPPPPPAPTSPMGAAPQRQPRDPWGRAAGAVLDPIGIFGGKGIGGLF